MSEHGGKAASMDLISHLTELRSRMLVIVVSLIVAFAITYTYSKVLYDILAMPLLAALPPEHEYLAFTGVVEPFYTYLKAALVSAVVLACPVILYEIWAFAAPGLYKNEKKWFFPVVFFSILLFLTGVLFAHRVVFPVGFKYLLSFAGSELRPVLSMGGYFSFATKLLVAFGAVFELPLFVLVLSVLGVVSGPGMLRAWKYALLVSVVVGAVLTPPDVFSQLLMAGPIMLLYSVSIIIAYVFGKKKK
ncbi:MAG: twin-arginine translocase subunit TatC [Thermodesulfobacteriota bacterium]